MPTYALAGAASGCPKGIKTKPLDISEMSKLFSYNPETGDLIWKQRELSLFPSKRFCRTWNSRFADKVAGTRHQATGYVILRIKGSGYKAHRIAWCIYYGKEPDGYIDHINGDGFDNRISNLRDVSHTINMRNQKLRSSNSSGFTGVQIDPRNNKYRVGIHVNGKNKSLGYFSTPEEANKAREHANMLAGYHPNHGRKQNSEGN